MDETNHLVNSPWINAMDQERAVRACFSDFDASANGHIISRFVRCVTWGRYPWRGYNFGSAGCVKSDQMAALWSIRGELELND